MLKFGANFLGIKTENSRIEQNQSVPQIKLILSLLGKLCDRIHTQNSLSIYWRLIFIQIFINFSPIFNLMLFESHPIHNLNGIKSKKGIKQIFSYFFLKNQINWVNQIKVTFYFCLPYKQTDHNKCLKNQRKRNDLIGTADISDFSVDKSHAELRSWSTSVKCYNKTQ